MKNQFLKSVICGLLVTAMIGCTGTTNTNTTPVVTTTAIADLAASTATSGGTVSSDGGATVTARGVCWSTSASPTISSSKTTNSSGTGSFTSSLTGLTASTTYYVRAYATNSEGTAYGNEISFTTTQATLPVLTTTTASALTATAATSGGTISTDGGSSVTARGICWSTSTGPTISLSTRTINGTGSGNFISNITGLTALTTYYARAYATNAVGTTYGNEISFTTPAVAANTTGTLTVSTSTSTAGGGYSPRNVVAIWIRTSTGAFVKSLLVYANARRYDLSNWYANSGVNTTDAVTGATQSSYATRTCTWNGTNLSGTVVPNGDYKVCMELCDGGLSYKEFTFTKGTTGVTLTPSNAGSFSNISIKWVPN